MLKDQQIEPQDSGALEDAFATLAGSRRELLLSLTVQEARTILALTQERAAIEAGLLGASR